MYATPEDRLASILKHSGLQYLQSNGEEISIQRKINKIGNGIVSKRTPIYRRVSQVLIEETMRWKETRNDLVHKSCSRLYENNEVKNCALEGNRIVCKWTNAAAAIKRVALKDE